VSDFDEYVAARGPALLALAVLVTGDEVEARRHVADGLARASPRWEALVHQEDPDAFLRRELLAATRRWRRGRRRPAEPQRPEWDPTPEQAAVWQEWLRLPADTRGVLALRCAERASWPEVSWLTGLPIRGARQRMDRGMSRLGRPDLVTQTLRRRVEALETWPVEISHQAARVGRRRRDRRVRVGVAAALAGVVAVPLGLAMVPGALGDLDVAPLEDRTAPEAVLPGGWRAESWRGVQVGVPQEWGYGSLSGWCAVGDGDMVPRVERPGRWPDLDCSPPVGPGLHFRTVADRAPDVSEDLVADEVQVGSVVVLAVTEDERLTEQVLSTVREVERLDAAGCEVQRPVPRAGRTFPPVEQEAGRTALSMCRYAVGISGPNLVQSERLSVLDSAEALRAVREAPEVTASQACLAGPGEEAVLVGSDQGDVAWIHLGRCQGMDDDGTHMLTEDVLYWALSPGWNGDRGDLPLPDRLRDRTPS
jgi:DNA-directed RNA polymerase specialized sigma24 family protein